MQRDEILAFLAENPVCFLATVEGGAPRVRGMRLFRADPSGILFQAGRDKDLARQVERNPAVEVCFYDARKNVQVRVTGTFEVVEDRALKDEVLRERPFLRPLVEAQGYEAVVVYRVKEPVATVWTMATNLVPKSYVRL